jgi:hypothetical protein
MAKVRAKVKTEPQTQNVEPTKVRSVAKQPTKKVEAQPKVVEKKVDDKKSTSDSRFERHKASGDLIKRAEISEKVKQGLLRWAFYGIENDNGYQYYLKIKK